MNKIILMRSTSQPEPYELRFSADGDCLTLRCYCPAGASQMLCKHVIALLSDDRQFIFDARQTGLFDEALAIAERSGAVEYCRQLEPKIQELKRQFEAARRELKDELCTRLREGQPFKS